MTQIVKSTSFSRAQDYAKCPLFFKLRHLDKVPDPAPDPEPGTERPMDRGTRLHKLAEDYVANPLLKFPYELRHHEKALNAFRVGYEQGKVDLELAVGFDSNWQVSAVDDFENTRYRMVIDVAAKMSDDRILVWDWKSGKKKGNEIKHHEQLMEYAVGAYLLDPDLQLFDVAIGYFDLHPGENVMSRTFTRSQVARAFPDMKAKHEKVLNATIFPATPSQFACRFCPYKAGTVGRGANAYPGTGHCRKNVV